MSQLRDVGRRVRFDTQLSEKLVVSSSAAPAPTAPDKADQIAASRGAEGRERRRFPHSLVSRWYRAKRLGNSNVGPTVPSVISVLAR